MPFFLLSDNRNRQNPFDEIQNLNFGGCGFFAYHLHQTNPSRYTIISLSDRRHVLCYDEIEKQWIDSHGYHSNVYALSISYVAFTIDTISEIKLRRWLDNPKLWNEKFDRKDTTRLFKLMDSVYINKK